MYKYNNSLRDKIWRIVPAIIGAGLVFILVRILMVYVVMFQMAVLGLGQ